MRLARVGRVLHATMGLMTTFASSTIPEAAYHRLQTIDPAYSVPLGPLSELSVTPEADAFFGLRPLVDVTRGRLERPAGMSARQPYLSVVLTAPHEVSDKPLAHEMTYFKRETTDCTFWVTHPETPQEYIADGFSVLAKERREADLDLIRVSDDEILGSLSEAERQHHTERFRTGQVADITNNLESYVWQQTSLLREGSFTQDQLRDKLLKGGMDVVILDQDGEALYQFRTLKQVALYGIRRAFSVTSALFGAFSPEPYTDHRVNRSFLIGMPEFAGLLEK